MWGKIFKAMDVIGKVCQFAEGTISLFMKLFSPQKAWISKRKKESNTLKKK